MKPAGTAEDVGPPNHAGTDTGDGRPLAIVEDAACSRRRAELQEIDPDAVFVGPENMVCVDSCFPGVVGNQATQWITCQSRHPCAGTPQPGKSDRGVQFCAANLDVETGCLLQT